MADKYTEKQLQIHDSNDSQAVKDDALYRLGTHLEVIPCGEDKLTNEQRETILNTARDKQS
ncbi:MAG: hypothetical protein KME29_03795 [Calothrix sp. FI2-JRJ7]|jgi:hypothetical protein|nr:hypothetical protein [Calothrix sp. FI2-JRJ7]MBW4598743.1 hypothetical protein [Calothrix sp. FI2-JRJ7]